MNTLFSRLYHSIRLHLGVKRYIKTSVDNFLFFSVFQRFEKYFYSGVIDHYGADYKWGDEESQNLKHSSLNYGFGLIHHAMVRNLRPKNILCVGSMYGFIPYMLAKACMENGSGHVDFVDAAYDFNDATYRNNHYFGQGFWKRVKPNVHFSYLLKRDYISTHIMTLEDFIHTHPIKYDYVYLDGDHSYKGLRRDINLVWPMLRQNGLLVLHDIEFDFKKSLKRIDGMFRQKVEHVSFGVQEIWQKFGMFRHTLPILNGYSGIGFILKTKNDKSNILSMK